MFSKFFDWLKNSTIYRNKYKTASDAVIVTCYFNPENNPYRLLAFQKFYNKIKHLNHRVVELIINDSDHKKSDLPDTPYIKKIYTDNLLFHKETLLNKVIEELPSEYKYVFWVDADLNFDNNNWLVDSVKELQTKNIVQPFEYCVHLDKNQEEPNFPVESIPALAKIVDNGKRIKKVWRSFSANFVDNNANSNVYDVHGHVGFAWGARRSILEQCPLYDRALIGGADHIMAHAAAGQINHECISKSFTDDIEKVNQWSKVFAELVDRKIGYVKGNVFHYYHGDLDKRMYLKRVKEFTVHLKSAVKNKDGFWTVHDPEVLNKIKTYYKSRESFNLDDMQGLLMYCEDFMLDMGYLFTDWFNTYYSNEEQSNNTNEEVIIDEVNGETSIDDLPVEDNTDNQNFS